MLKDKPFGGNTFAPQVCLSTLFLPLTEYLEEKQNKTSTASCILVTAPWKVKPLFLFKSFSWPNQIWSWGDGWLHFRETTPLRDPGRARITNGFLIIFHHPILCLSLILPMIPETSRELHLNLCDQSRLRSSLSLTCLTALNTPCVHKACVVQWQALH